MENPDSVAFDHPSTQDGLEAPPASASRPLLMTIVNMLEPYLKEASLVFKNGERVSIDETRDERTQCPGAMERLSRIASTGTGVSLVETSETRQLAVERFRNAIAALTCDERSRLLGTFQDSELDAYVAQILDLDQLEALRHKFTRQINALRNAKDPAPRQRPILDRRKIGRFLYKLQATRTGRAYWYLQFSEAGKKAVIYLGKEEPSFDPLIDLAKRKS